MYTDNKDTILLKELWNEIDGKWFFYCYTDLNGEFVEPSDKGLEKVKDIDFDKFGNPILCEFKKVDIQTKIHDFISSQIQIEPDFLKVLNEVTFKQMKSESTKKDRFSGSTKE